jgi:iron complex outermembrane receptor protein
MLTAHYAHVIDASAVALHPLNGITSGILVPGTVIPGKYQTAANQRQSAEYHTEGASLQFRHSFSSFDVSGLASYANTESQTNLDTDQTTRPQSYSLIGTTDETWTGELRAVSTGDGPLQWVVGVYYFDALACYCDLNTSGTIIRAAQGSKAYAAFGELTYDLTDRLSATAGLRYSEETRTIETYRNSVFVGTDEAVFDNISPRASLIYKINDRARVYATYSQGFKSGVYNAATTTLPLRAVNPEELTAYEIGLKSEPSRSIRFNLSAYYYDYTDLQVSSRDVVSNLTLLQNAAAVEIYGAEAQLDWALTSQWNVSAGLAFTHARFTDFPGANVLNNLPSGGGNASSFMDVSGKSVPKTPDYTLSVRSDYTVPLAAGELTFAGNVYYSSKYYSDFHNRLTTDAAVVINAQVSWLAPGQQWKLTALVDNLTDDDRPITQSSGALSDFQSEVRPRSFGVRVTYDF